MTIKFLKYVKKWLIQYHGESIAVGDTIGQALEDALLVIKYK